MTDDFPEDGRRPLQATLSAAEIDTALNRTPKATAWDVALSEGRTCGGVIIPKPRALAEGHPSNADQGAVLDLAADQDEPEEHAAKVRYWKAKAVYAPTAAEYERAVAHVTALTGTSGTAWEQAVLDATVAAITRGDLQAAEAVQVPPEEPIVERPTPTPKPRTKTVRIKRIIARDAQEKISEIIEFDIECPLDAHGEPILPQPHAP
jgi:hypothetical protein